jgi:pimeloyl-ACP methyl ester carboxylesterase
LAEKYVRRDGLPLLLRHTGPTTLPGFPPRCGARDTIICLHDAGLQSSVFAELLTRLGDALADRGSAIAFDLPGHGRSGSLDSLPSIEAMAEMARWVMGWCGIDRAMLIGHGMGALVALDWARTRPESVAGLLLCGAGRALDVGSDTIEAMRRVTEGKAPRPFDPSRVARRAGPDLIRRAYFESIQTDPRATLADLEACRAWSSAFDPNRIGTACPVRLMSGEDEAPEFRTRAETLAAAIEGAELETVPGAADLLPLEQPAALSEAALRLREGA